MVGDGMGGEGGRQGGVLRRRSPHHRGDSAGVAESSRPGAFGPLARIRRGLTQRRGDAGVPCFDPEGEARSGADTLPAAFVLRVEGGHRA